MKKPTERPDNAYHAHYCESCHAPWLCKRAACHGPYLKECSPCRHGEKKPTEEDV